MRTFFCILLTTVIFFNCSGKKSYQVKESNDSIKVVLTIKEFLTWYKENYNYVNQSSLVIYRKQNGHNTYMVDTIQSKRYLKALKESGYLSNNFINYWKEYFEERNKFFSENNNLDLAEGFDYDFILKTQEADNTLNEIDSMRVINYKFNENTYEVSVDIGMRLLFKLKMNNSKWEIESIENIGMN